MQWLLFMVPVLLLTFYAQWKVKSNYRKFSKIAASSGMTARQVAERIVDHGAISLGKPQLASVQFAAVQGQLTDHYDPRTKTVRLSNPDSRSLADIGIAAHEVGHAIQDAQNYGPLALRTAMVPVTQIGSKLASFLMIGFFVSLFLAPYLFQTVLIGLIAAYGIIALFTLVTLPVEFDASKRAMRLLKDTGAVTSQKELAQVGTVLNSAALTYVAAAAAAIMQLAYFVFILLGRR